MFRIRRNLSLAAIGVIAVTSLGLTAGNAGAVDQPSSQPRHAALPVAAGSGGPVADEVVAGVGEVDGYHLFVARSIDGWTWEPVALLDPAGETDQAWVGNTCTTGDGSTAVAVIAPWSMLNSPAGLERGGIAYAVDLATGRARVLGAGVSMAYFNPGCGSGRDVALTTYLGSSEQTTRVQRLDAVSGAVEATATVAGEFTSAVPLSGAILAAHGSALVRLAGASARRLARLPGQAFQLRPNSQGGLDLLSADSAATGTAWRYGIAGLHRLGVGRLSALALYAGHGGATALSGVSTATPAPGLTIRAGGPAHVLAASQLGTAVLAAPPKSVKNASGMLPEIVTASGAMLRPAQAPPTTSVPRTVTAVVPAGHAGARPDVTAPMTAQTPKCAIGRDDPMIQAPQPSNSQVDWAIQQAVAGTLPSRPAGFDNLPGGAYSPEADFPQPALTGGSSHVPALVVAGILAQESNFNQASWHAPVGTAGDPLIADYYGSGGSSSYINYPAADCGYGIGQITDIMNAGNSVGPTIQRRVAVDYAENIAASVQHLASTWNELAAYSPAITVNQNDPQVLENWYDTIWAYNSGVEPRDASYGLPAGCTAPGPGCTDSAGNWGLGWANNPINPIYPPDRMTFLETSYADAAHPGDWPYQERVFGWMATPLQRYSPTYGTYAAAYPKAVQYLQEPAYNAFCATNANNCNPSDPQHLYCGYQAAGPLQYHCWWHESVSFANGCKLSSAMLCTLDNAVSSATSEPATVNPDPPACDLDTSQVPLSTSAGETTLVTEESGPANPGGSDINVVGCTGSRNWSAAGTFAVTYATDSQGDPLGQVDFHQLGAGFGGHMFMTHDVPPSGAATNQVTGTWTPGITTAGIYQVKVFVPDLGAVADPAVYTITSGNGSTAQRVINQNDYGNQWVSLGDFALGANAAVSLTNVTPNGDYASDLAFSAVAFIPRGGRLVHHTIDGFSNFSDTQSLDTGPPSSWIAGDFASDSSLIQMADNLTNGLLNYPACPAGTTNSSCVASPVLTAMQAWQSQVAASNGHPVQWLGFSRAAPPSPLTPGYLDDGNNYKVRASVNVDFVVTSNGRIDPSSYTVTATNATGITHVPSFIQDMFTSIAGGYGEAVPDLTYSAENLEYFNGANMAVDPLGTGQAPGREYMPDLSVQLNKNNTCLQVQDLAGGSIGWKTLLTDQNVLHNARAWKNDVDGLVAAGSAPNALAQLADTVFTDFFSQPTVLGVIPQPDGSIFYYAPPIWVEDHFNDCVSGSTDVITPAGSVDPVTNKAQLIDSSYMPDLYLAIDGQYVDMYGNPTGGAPVQRGDWPDFSAAISASNTPWGPCYIGPITQYLTFISRRNGNPWGLAMLTSPGDPSSSVGFC